MNGDREVTEEDIQNYSLVIFGDPVSNRRSERLSPKLEPVGVQRTIASIRFGSKAFPEASHAPILMSPNPESPNRDLVVRAVLPQRRIQGGGATPQIRFEPAIGGFAVIDVAAGTESSNFQILGASSTHSGN